MKKRSNKEDKKSKELSEYPVIYSYIYEREVDDINRLANKINTIKNRKKSTPPISKIIIGYKVENGKVVPIYQD
ncbi:hypothetical protein [Sphingobacterium sp.]|uniref:hypothetical protein n=1 Tax=Sphingobacterium sp. TaxID=341027 RepID=UPI002FDCE31D